MAQYLETYKQDEKPHGSHAYLVIFICNHCPSDGPEPMREVAAQSGYTFPYLIDTEQDVAKAYQATCTPDFYLFDSDRLLVYRGQLDGSRPSNAVPVDGLDLRRAMDVVLADEPVPDDQVPSIGCSIKWIAGNEPQHSGSA